MPAAPQAYTLAPPPNVLHRFETQATSQGLQFPQVSAIFYLTLCRPAATLCTGTNQWHLSGSQVEYESTRQQLSLHYRLLRVFKRVCFSYALPFFSICHRSLTTKPHVSRGVFRFPKTRTCKKNPRPRAARILTSTSLSGKQGMGTHGRGQVGGHMSMYWYYIGCRALRLQLFSYR